MSRIGQNKNPTIGKRRQRRVEHFLRNKEVFLDLGDQNLLVKSQLTKLGCKVLTLPNNLTSATAVFISAHPLKHYTRKRLSGFPVDLLMKHSRGGRAVKMLSSMQSPAFRQPTSKSILLKAQSLNPRIKFHYYPEIKARLNREVKVNHPHEYRFDFDMSAIKSRYPNACQYFITDAKGVHKIEPHIITEPPTLYLDHPCDHLGSYFAKPKKQHVIKKRKNSRLDIKVKAPRKRKQRVCDGCLRRYTDLDLHNNSKEHQEWYKATNFDDVDEFISMVNRKLEKEERLRRKANDPQEKTTPNVQNVEQNVSFPNTKEVEQNIEQVASPLHSETNRNFKLDTLSTASNTTVSTALGHSTSCAASKRSERGLETRTSPDKGSLDRPSQNEVPAKIKVPGVKTSCYSPTVNISDHPRSLRIHISSPNSAITIEQNPTSSYSQDPLSSSKTLRKVIKKSNKRTRKTKQAISPPPILHPKVAKVAVTSNSGCVTSQPLCKPPFAPYQRILQPRIIEALRTREYKSRSAKRRKRKEVTEVLYRLSGKVKPKFEDRRLKMHTELRTLVTEKFKRNLKTATVRNSQSISKPVAAAHSKNKQKSCLSYAQETSSKKLQQHKHTGRLTAELGRLPNNLVAVKRKKRKSKLRKRVPCAKREVTAQKGVTRSKLMTRGRSKSKTHLNVKSRKKQRLL
jgi:hypothetical protein